MQQRRGVFSKKSVRKCIGSEILSYNGSKNLRKMETFQSARKRPKRVKCACFDYFSKIDSLRVGYSDIVIIVIYSINDAQNVF